MTVVKLLPPTVQWNKKHHLGTAAESTEGREQAPLCSGWNASELRATSFVLLSASEK